MTVPTRSPLTCAVDDRATDLNPVDSDQGENSAPRSADLLATLIEQLQENWDHDDNAANDELVMRIRELIRRQRAAASGAHPVQEG